MRTQVKTSGTFDTTSLLTVAQVCTILGIGRTKFYTLLDQGLPTIKLGGSRRIRQASLERWLERKEQSVA
ncbi:MAG: helix-turn-helix domain-containing protein [Ktedonobacteraceae bacterium]